MGYINDDDRLDIVVPNDLSDSVSVLLQNANGTFARTDVDVGNEPTSVALGDINRDGRLDIVATNFEGDTTSVLLQGAGGAFSGSEIGVGHLPYAVALADLDAGSILTPDGSPYLGPDVPIVADHDWA